MDEVGQFVADDVKLMTNLQTIAESLATRCKGQSWIIVTAQEDMENVIGEMSRTKGMDFSKIQDRFKTRMKLTSQNVDEVIQTRLLKKNKEGEKYSREVYAKEKNNFGTLFDFTDGATQYKNFKDEDHFINCYPFIPYQFSLFQTAIINLSAHGAFTGQHSSVGERSMLGVFQDAAVKLADQDVGKLATFDQMFEGIRAVLQLKIQYSVLVAEKQLTSDFAKRVLKALFLVKYVKGFNATPRNLRILLQESFNQDTPALLKNVKEALDLLELQTYVQRNGETYEFLTDEEKDVEQEIKTTDMDTADIARTLEDLFFAGVVKETKIRYEISGQDYPFTKKLDDRVSGREYELTIHCVSPFNELINDLTLLRSHSMGRPELLVVLPAEAGFMHDLVLFKKTEKYIKVNTTTTQQEAVKMILTNKAYQNNERFRQIQQKLNELVSRARFFMGGDEIEIAGDDPRSRVVKGFNQLIIKVYPNLRMLKNATYSENDIRNYLNIAKGTLLTEEPSEAEKEMLSYISINGQTGNKTTMKRLEEQFTKAPYGWYLAAIQCLVAMLAGRGKIEARLDANILENERLESALKNTHGFGALFLEPQPDIPPSQLHWLKDFFSSFFDKPASAHEPKEIGNETRQAFQDLVTNLKLLKAQSNLYPFLSVLDSPIIALNAYEGKDYAFYFRELPAHENELMDMKENILDPVCQFMAGPNRSIYDESRKFFTEQKANFSAVANGRSKTLEEILLDPDCFKGKRMQEAKSLTESLKGEIDQQLKITVDHALEKVQQLEDQLEKMDDYQKLDDQKKKEVLGTLRFAKI